MTLAILKPKKRELSCGKFALPLNERTHIMGVLNRTPDSFSDGGKYLDGDAAIGHAMKMATSGADIIDIGGESARPGSLRISKAEELDRTIPIVRKLSRELNIPISIDTQKHQVALEAIKHGASIVNDISGLKGDPKMAEVISGSGAAVCVMHMKGTSRNMQEDPQYDDLIGEIMRSLKESLAIAGDAGISAEKIIVDPGIGFGKRVEHNLEILRRLREFTVLDKPVLIGTSRKSFIGKVLERDVSERLMGTAATCALAIANGASIIRVHDVKEMTDVALMTDAVRRGAK